MNDVFLRLLRISYYAAWIVLPVVILRILLRKWPKRVFPFLWGLVGFRILFPFSIESPLSLVPRFPYAGTDAAQGKSIFSNEGLLTAFSVIWIVGFAALFLYGLISTMVLRCKLRTAIRESGRVYRSEYADAPFILGIIMPRIYLPFRLTEEQAVYVVAHEEAHIRRKDHWRKPIGYGILCLYWFHPAIWIAYLLLCRDIEFACDEAVVRDMTIAERAAYSQTLLSCTANRSLISVCPLSFGIGSVGQRIRSVLSYKRPTRWMQFVIPVLTLFIVLCFMTVPAEPKAKPFPDITSEEQLYGTWTIDRIDYRTHNDEEIQTLRGNQIDLRLHIKFYPDGVVHFLAERNHHETVGMYQVSGNIVTIWGKEQAGVGAKLHLLTATYNTEDDTLCIPVQSLCTEYFSRSSEPVFHSENGVASANHTTSVSRYH